MHFYPDAMWDENEYIAVNLFCYDTGRNYSTVVHQKEDDPKEIIRLIQNLASESEIIEFNVSDSEWEHDLSLGNFRSNAEMSKKSATN